jgi:molybdate-binding protein
MTIGSIVSLTGCSKRVDVATAPAPEVETDKHKALRAVAGFSSGLDAVQDVLEKLQASHFVDNDEARAVASGIKNTTFVNDQAAKKISAFASIDGSNRNQVIAYLREIADSVKQLHEQGVTHVKNPEAKERLRLAFGVFDAAMALADSFN